MLRDFLISLFLLLPSFTSQSLKNVLPESLQTPTDLFTLSLLDSQRTSRVCDAETTENSVQCFSQLPAELYEVLEGDTVKLRCRVQHQKGKAQWSAGNFLLGYDRTIPGRQRFRYEGNPKEGQHDLVITNVSFEDNGEYECQVSPANGEPLLKKKTRINVLVIPKVPMITAPVGEPQPSDDNRIIITTGLNAAQTIRLTCSTQGGYPSPTLEWFYNGIKKTSSAENTTQQMTLDRVDIKNKKYQIVMHLKRDELKNGDRLVCLVMNQATLRSAELDKQKLRKELTVFLNSPSGKPKISSSEEMAYREGDELTAECRASPPGFPRAKLSWKWLKSDERISHRFHEEDDSNAAELISRLNFPKLDRRHHGDEITCTASHSLGYVFTDNLRIFMTHEFKMISILGPYEGMKNVDLQRINFTSQEQIDKIYVDLSKEQHAMCVTDEFYGRAEIKWTAKYRGNDQWRDVLASDAKLVNSTTNEASNQLISLVRIDDLIGSADEIKCQAYFEDVMISSMSAKLEEMVPLSKPKIIGFNPKQAIPTNSVIKFECLAEMGNPSPTISWFENDSPYLSTSKLHGKHDGFQRKVKDQIISTISLHITSDYHSKYIFCAVSNEKFEISKETISDPIHLNVSFLHPGMKMGVKVLGKNVDVIYPNTQEDIRLDRMKLNSLNTSLSKTNLIFTPFLRLPFVEVTSDKELSLECVTGVGNPPPLVIWKQWQCPSNDVSQKESKRPSSDYITDISKSIDIQQSCRSIIINQNIVERTKSNNEGFLVESYLTIRTDRIHDSDIFECIAVQNLETSKPDSSYIPNINSFGLQLLVRSKPEFLYLDKLTRTGKDSYQYQMTESKDFVIDLGAKANPILTNIQWLRNGKPFASITHSDLINHDTSKTSRIHVNPLSGEFRLNQVTHEDMAEYKLIAENSLGMNEVSFFLNITHSPILIGERVINITLTKEEADLECVVKANPIPHPNAIRWRKIGHGYSTLPEIDSKDFFNDFNSNNSDPFSTGITCGENDWKGSFKYSVKCSITEEGLLKSSLLIRQLDSDDVGRYQCFIDNGIGSPASKIIDLIYPFKPKFLPLPRWSKAAPAKLPPKFLENPDNDKNLRAERTALTCIFAAEPSPTVVWSREPANQTLIEGGQFSSSTERLRPGLYRSRLILNHVRPTDFGKYYCEGTNFVGTSTGSIQLVTPSAPDMPNLLTAINKTSSTITIRFNQGYNGGMQQTFQIRAKVNENPTRFVDFEIKEDESYNLLTFTLKGLTKASTYQISVAAKNEIHGTQGFTDSILVSTSDSPIRNEDGSENLMGDEGLPTNQRPDGLQTSSLYNIYNNLNGSDYNLAKIITIACIIGILVVMANFLLVGFIMKKKCRRDGKAAQMMSPSHQSKLDSFDPLVNGYPMCNSGPNSMSGTGVEYFANGSKDFLYLQSNSCLPLNYGGSLIPSVKSPYHENGSSCQNFETNSLQGSFCMPMNRQNYDNHSQNLMLSSASNLLDDSSKFLFTGSNTTVPNRNQYNLMMSHQQNIDDSESFSSLPRNNAILCNTIDRTYQHQDYEYKGYPQTYRAISPTSSTGIGSILNNPRYGYSTHLQPFVGKYPGRVSHSPCIPSKNMTTSFHVAAPKSELNGNDCSGKYNKRIYGLNSSEEFLSQPDSKPLSPQTVANCVQKRPSFNKNPETGLICDTPNLYGNSRHMSDSSSLRNSKMFNCQTSQITESSAVVIPPPTDFENSAKNQPKSPNTERKMVKFHN